MPDTTHHNADRTIVECAVVTVSDTRTPATDKSGALIQELLQQAGHTITGYAIVPDEPQELLGCVRAHCESGRCHAVILTGGTGIAPRDTTPDALVSLYERKLDGFGELFRMLSFREIGPAAMLSRASAGVYRQTVIFSLPGSTAAVRMAMTELIIPQLGHIAGLLR